MLSFNVDFVVECVKNISDNTQCLTCGKLTGPCVRFPCGHSVCKDCAEKSGECVTCVCSSNETYMLDKPQSHRLYNTSQLLTTFQDTFKMDVYKKQRISDQLKLEKQVFPGCIQAPYQYFNKRKSLNILRKNKENIGRVTFLGEQILCSDKDKMKKSHQYVQNWLNQHEDIPQNLPRKPFGDININTSLLIPKGKKNITKLNKIHTDIESKISTFRKKSYFKAKNHSPSLLEDYMKPNLKDNNEQETATKVETSEECLKIRKCDRNESGIVIDEEQIVVDDSQLDIIDKDHQAWLAVLKEAEEKENRNKQIFSKCRLQTIEHSLHDTNNDRSTSRLDNVHNVHKVESGITQRVLFFKKGSLFETCHLCNKFNNSEINCHSKTDENNDVSITINSSEFVISIQCSRQNISEMLNKSTVAIQTDKTAELIHNIIINEGKKTINKQKRKSMLIEEQISTKIIKPNDAIRSLDIFSTLKSNEQKLQSNCDNDAIKQNIYNDSLEPKHLIIEESDTDSNISHENIHEVVADVHRSSAPENVQQGILKTLSITNYHQRSKQPLRGHTPNSSDSSDKENLDPNRNKQSKFGKKLKNKKLTHRKC